MAEHSGADYSGADLREARFARADLRGADFWAADLSGARFRGAELCDVTMRGVELARVDISGAIEDVTVNGVSIGPLVEAELNRRYPDRAKMRPADPAGFRAAWDILGRLWGETVARARRLPPERLHESVDGEWSFTETQRHLVFATDSWVRRGMLGEPTPWDPLGLPWDEAPDDLEMPLDRAARPSLEEVLALRRDRMATVSQVLSGLTDESLAGETAVDGPGWPPAGRYPVRQCLRIVLNEEWEHRLYAERDLAVLEARA